MRFYNYEDESAGSVHPFLTREKEPNWLLAPFSSCRDLDKKMEKPKFAQKWKSQKHFVARTEKTEKLDV